MSASNHISSTLSSLVQLIIMGLIALLMLSACESATDYIDDQGIDCLTARDSIAAIDNRVLQYASQHSQAISALYDEALAGVWVLDNDNRYFSRLSHHQRVSDLPMALYSASHRMELVAALQHLTNAHSQVEEYSSHCKSLSQQNDFSPDRAQLYNTTHNP